MANSIDREDAIIDAALRLAATRDWRYVRLSDIAAEAGLELADLAGVVKDKTDILCRFARRTDQALLKSLKSDPVSGEVYDRLFEIIMRRLEILSPHRQAIANILEAPPERASEWARLTSSVLQSQGWMLTAAGIEDTGAQETLKLGGLACVYGRALRTWVRDEDAGRAKTMSVLDRSLRDGAQWLRRAEAPLAFCTAMAGLARGVFRSRRPPPADHSAQTAVKP